MRLPASDGFGRTRGRGTAAAMEEERNDEPDWSERAADVTEESRRRRGEEGVTIADEPDSEGEISDHPERQL